MSSTNQRKIHCRSLAWDTRRDRAQWNLSGPGSFGRNGHAEAASNGFGTQEATTPQELSILIKRIQRLGPSPLRYTTVFPSRLVWEARVMPLSFAPTGAAACPTARKERVPHSKNDDGKDFCIRRETSSPEK